jgi:hypothetical protein
MKEHQITWTTIELEMNSTFFFPIKEKENLSIQFGNLLHSYVILCFLAFSLENPSLIQGSRK